MSLVHGHGRPFRGKAVWRRCKSSTPSSSGGPPSPFPPPAPDVLSGKRNGPQDRAKYELHAVRSCSFSSEARHLSRGRKKRVPRDDEASFLHRWGMRHAGTGLHGAGCLGCTGTRTVKHEGVVATHGTRAWCASQPLQPQNSRPARRSRTHEVIAGVADDCSDTGPRGAEWEGERASTFRRARQCG